MHTLCRALRLAWVQKTAPTTCHLFSALRFLILSPLHTFPLGENKMLNASVSFAVTVRFFYQASWKETVECLRIIPKPFRGTLPRRARTQPHLHSQTPSPTLSTLMQNILAALPRSLRENSKPQSEMKGSICLRKLDTYKPGVNHRARNVSAD